MTIGAIYIANGGRTGSYNLDAGTLHVLGYNSSVFLSNNGGSVNYYLNGGTIQVGASAANLIAGNAYVKEGGAYINDGGNSVTIQVPLRHGGIATTDGGLTKSGNGTLTLSATNTYTGATTNNAGTLLVNGTHTGGLDYSVLGGTLGGTGVVGSAVSVGASGTLTAGDASTSGTLTITGNVSFVSGGQLVVNILKGGYDQIDMNNTGAFDASNGKLTIIASPEPGGPVSGTRLVIVKNIKGPLANTFSNAANGATVYASDGFYYVICYDAAEHQIYLTVHRGTLIRFM